MTRIKLTALSSILFALVISLSACERNAEEKKITEFSKLQIPMTGAQETPPVTTSALGSMDVHYSKETRILTYKVSWSGLTDSVLLMHIHGTAPIGYAAGVIQNIVAPPNPPSTVTALFPQKNAAGRYTFAKTGTLNGTFFVDGVVVKEQDLLNGFYYINIHTVPFPNGELRGQIVFQ